MSAAPTTIWLVRHGQASFGAQNYDRLSALGKRQATMLGRAWRSLDRPPAIALSGGLKRQNETAECVIAALGEPFIPLRIDPAFSEYRHAELIAAYQPVVARDNREFNLPIDLLTHDPLRFKPFFRLCLQSWMCGEAPALPLTETWPAFRARCVGGLLRAATSADRVAVFTSGGVILAALQAALALDDAETLALYGEIPNASVHTFACGDGALTLRRTNEVAHLTGDDAALLTSR